MLLEDQHKFRKNLLPLTTIWTMKTSKTTRRVRRQTDCFRLRFRESSPNKPLNQQLNPQSNRSRLKLRASSHKTLTQTLATSHLTSHCFQQFDQSGRLNFNQKRLHLSKFLSVRMKTMEKSSQKKISANIASNLIQSNQSLLSLQVTSQRKLSPRSLSQQLSFTCKHLISMNDFSPLNPQMMH